MNRSLVAAGAVIALAAWVAVSTADATLMMRALGRCRDVITEALGGVEKREANESA